MNAKLIVASLLIAAAAAATGWFAGRRLPSGSPQPDQGTERRILFYQSAMHPWIKSDKPGNCTICGMKLTPVYEGEKVAEVSAGIVTLPSNSVTVVHLKTTAVERRKIERTLRVAGRIDDDDTRHRFVSAYVDGRIDKLSVNFVGAEVGEGEPLATFYSPQLLTAEREYLAVLGAGTNAPPTAAMAVQSHLITGAEQRLRRLGLSGDQIRQLKDKADGELHTDLRAPVSGTVVQRFVYEGQYVKEGDKLFEIADFGTMWFLFDAYEQDLAWLNPGLPVEVTSQALPGKVFTSSIKFIDPNLNALTRSAQVRVEILNPLIEGGDRKRRLLSHRLYGDAVVRGTSQEVLALPRSAVLQSGSHALAYVELGQGVYRQKKVELGRVGDAFVEVISGLAEGDRVVTAGNLLVDAQAQLNQSAMGTEPH